MGFYAHGCAPNAVDRDDGGARERTNDNGEEEDGAALLKVEIEREEKWSVAYKRAGRAAAELAPGVRITTRCVSASAGDPGSQPLRCTARYALAWQFLWLA